MQKILDAYGRTSPLASRHDLPYHVVGSDLAGVVPRTGAGVNARILPITARRGKPTG